MAGFLDFIGGVAQGADEQIRARQQRRIDLQQKIQETYASEAIKNQFDPESQAKSQALSLIRSLAPQVAPRPLGGYNPQEQVAGIPQQVQNRTQLNLLEESGLLPRQASPTSIYSFNPTTGQTTAAGVVPPHARVFSTGQAGTTPQTDIESAVQGIMKGDIAPDGTQVSYRDRTRVSGELERKGINSVKLQSDWIAIKTATKSMNNPQQLRMRQALESVQQSIPQLRQLSEEFDRSNWRPVSSTQLRLALTGTDPSKRDLATRYIAQIRLMQDELAQGFMGGNSPTDRAFNLTVDILDPKYGGKQMSAALDQLETNLGIRMNAIRSTPPLTAGGEFSPQYSQFSGQASSRQAPPQSSGTPQGKIRVRRKSDGKSGTIDANDFDPSRYDRR